MLSLPAKAESLFLCRSFRFSSPDPLREPQRGQHGWHVNAVHRHYSALIKRSIITSNRLCVDRLRPRRWEIENRSHLISLPKGLTKSIFWGIWLTKYLTA